MDAAARGGRALDFAAVGIVGQPVAVEFSAALLHHAGIAGQDHGVFGNLVVDGCGLSVHQGAVVLGLPEMRRIAGQHHALPFTGVIRIGVARGFRAIGVQTVLLKPYTIESLGAAIEQILATGKT